jgi:hypothetical protein
MSGRRSLDAPIEPIADLHMVAAWAGAGTGTLTLIPDIRPE